MRIKNKVSLVTGASRGNGRAIAVALAREGAAVVINCSASVEAAGGWPRKYEDSDSGLR
jgi:3-oxoacyl-[acyl-carrier protein] reductase